MSISSFLYTVIKQFAVIVVDMNMIISSKKKAEVEYYQVSGRSRQALPSRPRGVLRPSASQTTSSLFYIVIEKVEVIVVELNKYQQELFTQLSSFSTL